ncbi:MAG: 50S ribosomal protein L4 [Candidatus Zixiibacteriota bacterium]
MEVKVYNKEGAETGTITLSNAIFGLEPNPTLVHQYIVNYLANQRQGTSSCKGRSDVSGSGAKPWRQKGTGRARSGTRRSPLWRGGGIIFGPEPRNYYNRFPRKMKRTALLSAFSDKARIEGVMVVEDLELAGIKSKVVSTILDKLGLDKKKCLILDEGVNRNLHMSVRNMDKVNYSRAALANAFDVVNADVLLVTRAGLEKIEEVFA